MKRPRSQSDNPPEKRYRFRQTNPKKQRIQDHAQWSANLAERRILDQAIAADAWIEYSDYYGRYSLCWREKRRDGRPGARRRRFTDPPVINGKQVGKSIWFYNEKTDELFHYLGSLDDLKQAIAEAGGKLYIVEGEIDVWSMHALGIRNVIGIYGISNIPKDIAAFLDEVGAARIVYYADNDAGGEKGGSNLATLLHKARWKGEAEYRSFAVLDMPHKGDVNVLLCQHYPDIPATRAALDALTHFEPKIEIERDTARKRSPRKEYNEGSWDAVNQAITDTLGLHASDFKANGFTKKNFSCLNPQHEDKTASAGWSRDGHYNCFVCGSFKNTQIAEWLNIPWRALLRPQPQQQQPDSSKNIDLAAAPHQAPDQPAWQRDSRPPLVMPYPTPSPQDAPSRCVAGLHIERYARVTDIPAAVWEHAVIALRAQQGGGKTYALYQMARAAMRAGKRVLWLAPNISQTERARAQLPDAIHYAELQRRGDIVTASSAITTWKSLHHFLHADGAVSQYDLIIADEFHLALPQLAGQIFRDDQALVATDTAKALLSAASQVIAASADMTGLEVEWLHKLSGRRAYIIDNPHSKPLPPATEYHNQHRMLNEALALAAGAEAPVFIGLGAKRQARALAELAISRGLSEADIALVTADTQRERPDIRQLVADPDAHCERYRLVLYTSAISEGFSYSGPCAGTFVSASNPGLTPVRYSQMLHRARAKELLPCERCEEELGKIGEEIRCMCDENSESIREAIRWIRYCEEHCDDPTFPKHLKDGHFLLSNECLFSSVNREINKVLVANCPDGYVAGTHTEDEIRDIMRPLREGVDKYLARVDTAATLKDILLQELEDYTGEGLNDSAYLTTNETEGIYTVVDIATVRDKRLVCTVLVARLVGNRVVIELDRHDKFLADALKAQIILAYQGETA